jgi:CRISPR system Cascade subunit CasB
MHRHVLPWVPSGLPQYQEDWYYMVASLFATHRVDWQGEAGNGRSSLGASFAQLARRTDSQGVERRFMALLECDAEDLPEHLRHAVSLLKAHEVAVDWAELLRDVLRWDSDERCIQRKWARTYWRTDTTGGTAEPTGTNAASDEAESVER